MTRSDTAEWSWASSTTTWPKVNGVPLSSELASSTRNWSATVHRRRLPPGPGSSWSTSRIGCCVGHALATAARSSGDRSHTSSRSVRRSSSRCTRPFSHSRRLLTGVTPSSACVDPPGELVGGDRSVSAPRSAGADRRSGRTTWPTLASRQPIEHLRRTLPSSRRIVVDAGDRRPSARRCRAPCAAAPPLAERRQHVGDVVEEHRVRARPPARRRGRAGDGARTAGTRRGASRPRSCRCPAHPARPGTGRAAHG